uniref:Uncharacterized protein n=1 Tax=Rhizophora mucronata TaxID=61149 RepID=A0A2P2KMM8_RHIMU
MSVKRNITKDQTFMIELKWGLKKTKECKKFIEMADLESNKKLKDLHYIEETICRFSSATSES